MMSCNEARDLLPTFVGGECAGEDADAVEAHVALCGPCARELDQFREARSALASLRGVEPPPGLGRAIWAGVREEIRPKAARPRVAWADELLRAAAILMLGLAGGVSWHFLRPSGGSDAEPVVERPSWIGDVRTVEHPAPVLRPLPLPRGEAEGQFYLPRVEAFPADGAKDF